MGIQERKQIIQQLERARGSKVICYLTSDRQNAGTDLATDVMPFFYQQLRALEPIDKLDVFLFTLGGDVVAAFGLAQLVREFCQQIGTLIPEKCQSAGTLFAIGANEIVMTRAGTLGPVDPSITTQLNPSIELAPGQRTLVPISVESVAGFQNLVTSEWKMQGEDALISAFRLLAERVHPLALGDVVRSREQIQRLARKLLNNHRQDDPKIDEIVTTLTQGLGSHDYLIYSSEARDLFGAQVAAHDASLEDLIWRLYRDFADEMELGVPFDAAVLVNGLPDPTPTAPLPQYPQMTPELIQQLTATGQLLPVMQQMQSALQSAAQPQAPRSVKVVLRSVVVESLAGSDVLEREMDIAKAMVPQMGMGMVEAIQARIVRAGWMHYDS